MKYTDLVADHLHFFVLAIFLSDEDLFQQDT